MPGPAQVPEAQAVGGTGHDGTEWPKAALGKMLSTSWGEGDLSLLVVFKEMKPVLSNFPTNLQLN